MFPRISVKRSHEGGVKAFETYSSICDIGPQTPGLGGGLLGGIVKN